MPPNPTELAAMDRFDAAVVAVMKGFDFAQHPYFVWLESNRATREAFLRSQLPFRHAVEGFSQPLAAVLARTPSLEARLPIADNVWEEHGRGTVERAHKHTFRGFLRSLGASDADLEAPCPITVTAFNRALLDHCLCEQHEVGAAMLGIIEQLYMGISHAISHTIVAREWVTQGGQEHYVLHERLDAVHARDLFALARPAWNVPALRLGVATALALGALHFWRLYGDLVPTD